MGPHTWTWKDEVVCWLSRAGLCLLALIPLTFVVLLVDVLGYCLGLWHVSCALDSSQPHCVTGGWGHHIDAVIKSSR